MRLTVKERILLHLLEFVKHTEDAQVPPELTRDGLAHASWIDVRHVPQSVRPLIREGLLVERTSHVRGASRRRKTYALTEAGRLAASQLREGVRNETVQVRDAAGVHSSTVSQILRQVGGGTSLLDVVRRSMVTGPLDLSAMVSSQGTTGPGPPTPGFVEMLDEAPRVERFIGRNRQLQAITSEGSPHLVVVQGVAGIGKSWFGAKSCDLLRGTKNLFWHRVRPWDTSQSVLAGIGDFLNALGRPNLRSVIVRGDGALARRIMRDDLHGANAMLVFDDGHDATPEVLELLRDLKDIVASTDGVRILVLARRSLPFYDRRDVALSKTVIELDLPGLDIEELAALMTPGGETLALLNVSRRLGGHPLLIELARATGHPATAGEYLRDARKFLEEQVNRDLSTSERQMMKLAALYRTPVPREALFASPELGHDVLTSLQAKSLIRRVGADTFETHDTIRDYYDSILVGSERRALGRYALDQLRALAARAEEVRNYPSSIDYLSNALQLPLSDQRRVELLEGLGDAYQWIGDLLETLTAYKEALARTEDPETLARIHRKAARAHWVRGDKSPAWKEVQSGLATLGTGGGVERGWLELIGAFVDPCVNQDGDQPLPPIRDALRIFREFGEKRGEAEALLSLGIVLIHAPGGDLLEGERLLREGLQRATLLLDHRLISEAHTDLVHFYVFHRPDVEEAMLHIVAAESSAQDQDSFTRSNALYFRVLARTEVLGDLTRAEADLKEVVVLARRTYDAEREYRARHQLANLAFYRGNLAEARGAHEALWQESKAADWFMFKWAAHSLLTAAECCLLQADREGFERLVAELEGSGVQEHVSDRIVVVDVLLGLAAFIDGDQREYGSRFSRALRAAESSFTRHEAPFQFQSFVAPYLHGITLRAAGRGDEAAPRVARALDVLQTYGMKSSRNALIRDQDRFVQVLSEWAQAKPHKA